jgi:hypothetical protein
MFLTTKYIIFFIDFCFSSGWGNMKLFQNDEDDEDEDEDDDRPSNVLQYINAYRLPTENCQSKVII